MSQNDQLNRQVIMALLYYASTKILEWTFSTGLSVACNSGLRIEDSGQAAPLDPYGRVSLDQLRTEEDADYDRGVGAPNQHQYGYGHELCSSPALDI